MDIASLMQPDAALPLPWLWSPGAFAGLLALAVGLVWLAFRPSAPAQAVAARLDGYLERDAGPDEMERPLTSRVLAPLLRKLLRALGRLAPKRNAEMTRQMLLQAGEPGRLTVLDFFGLRLLCALVLGGVVFLLVGRSQSFLLALRIMLAVAALGFFIPLLWLRSRVRSRRRRILRALPDALDMLTIGVEAGLAFESALLRVGEKWDNPLTRELKRAVGEMRVGTPRDVALGRMAERCGVEDLNTFVAVLVQSNQLGVSIAEVLHTQAAQMRLKRRQRVEELARQAGVKMVFPLVFFVLPALIIVGVGPSIPRMASFFAGMMGSMPAR